MELTQRQQQLIDRLKGRDEIKILFVCLGNICRSPAAEGVMRAIVEEHGAGSRFVLDSAGTGGWHVGQLPDKRMRVHAQRRGLTLEHCCRQMSESDFDEFDIIIGMDRQKIVPMAAFVDMAMRYDYIPDPYYEGAEGFELVLDLLADGCERLYEALA